MFDDKDFSKSKLYFKTIQLCRVFSNWIEETKYDLQLSHDKFVDPHSRGPEGDFGEVSFEWKRRIEEPLRQLSLLLEQVKRKREEVQSLRDGVSYLKYLKFVFISRPILLTFIKLFNATAVREASKSTDLADISTRQNQYLFVFTLLTVIYLPLSFVVVRYRHIRLHVYVLTFCQSVFGMHLFDSADPGIRAARPKFYVTITVLPLATYVTAALGYWLVRRRKERGSKADFKSSNV
jgi:hypothetical protein